jgi:thiol-disulfide isomerase/thioredoxin
MFGFVANAAKPDSIVLEAKLENCSSLDSFALYEADGVTLRLVKMIHSPVAGSGEWEMKLAKSPKSNFYYYGKNDDTRQLKLLLLGSEPKVKITGVCFDPTTSVVESPLNADYERVRMRNDDLKRESNKLIRRFQQTQDSMQRKTIEAELGTVDVKKIAFLDSLKKKNPFFAKIFAIDTYTSYQNAKNKSSFKDEVDYFLRQYFQYANLGDEDFNRIPQLTDAVRNYTGVVMLPNLGLKPEAQKNQIETLLTNFPANSKAYKLALSGVVVSLLERQNNENVVYFGEKYIQMYGKEDAQVRAMVQDAVTKFKASMIGVVAPDIVQADTSGKPLSLSTLRGKIVMIDFWASWCGPCRRDNPHVVGLYQKYRDRGFDIFSVSLDQSRDRWIQAIKDDRLSWPSHVSDLQQWSNAAARLYGVNSVPHTVLLDREGKIIARNLRGEALDRKLKEIFGEK